MLLDRFDLPEIHSENGVDDPDREAGRIQSAEIRLLFDARPEFVERREGPIVERHDVVLADDDRELMAAGFFVVRLDRAEAQDNPFREPKDL